MFNSCFKLRLKITWIPVGVFSVLQKCKSLHELQGQKNEYKCPSPQRVVSMPTSNFYYGIVWLHNGSKSYEV